MAGPGNSGGGDCWGDFEARSLPEGLAGERTGGEFAVDMAVKEGFVEEKR